MSLAAVRQHLLDFSQRTQRPRAVIPVSLIDIWRRQSHSASSKTWLARQVSDPYVRARHRALETDGGETPWRSRAAYKLLEICDRYPSLLRRGDVVIDLGAAPGSWSQVAVRACTRPEAATGTTPQPPCVIAVDLLPIAPLPNVLTLRCDFTSRATQATIEAAVVSARGKPGADVVLSDLAHSFTGSSSLDGDRQARLAWEAVAFARSALRPGGRFLVKVRQGPEHRVLADTLKVLFALSAAIKPPASRADSAEGYLIGLGFIRAAWPLPARNAMEKFGVEPG